MSTGSLSILSPLIRTTLNSSLSFSISISTTTSSSPPLPSLSPFSPPPPPCPLSILPLFLLPLAAPLFFSRVLSLSFFPSLFPTLLSFSLSFSFFYHYRSLSPVPIVGFFFTSTTPFLFVARSPALPLSFYVYPCSSLSFSLSPANFSQQ